MLRKLLIASLFCLVGCYHPIDLTKPMCIVVPWDEPMDVIVPMTMKGWRIWFRHLPETPYPIVVRERKACEAVPFEFRIVKELGGNTAAYIKYETWGYSVRVELDDQDWPIIYAHELGHALLEDFGHVDPERHLSIMNPTARSCIVTPLDMKRLCDTHEEIECPEWTWCQDTFNFEGWCPSANPEEGWTKIQAGASK